MKRKIKIGIPRAFLYYRDYILWKNFFDLLGANIVLSPFTNKDILERGKKLSVDEACLPLKIYLGHIDYLKDKCDYLLIPRINNYGKKKRACIRFNGIYDVVNNLFDIKILNYNIDNLNFKYELIEFIKMGFKINKNIFRIIYAYIYGKIKQKKYNKDLLNKQDKIFRSNNLKILIVSHPYIMYDDYLFSNIKKYLNEEQIEILYSDRFNKKESILYAEDFSNTLYFLYSKENIGSIFHYKNNIDGIIFLSSFPCGPDSLVNELVIRNLKDIPILNIILDESSSTSGLYTRLESFIDIIKERKNNE